MKVAEAEIVHKQQEIQRLQAVQATTDNRKQQEILELGMLILNLDQQHRNQDLINLDAIFMEEEGDAAQLRVNIQELITLIRFTYCLDPVSNVPAQQLEDVIAILRRG